MSNESTTTFARRYDSATVFETPLGPVHIIDTRKAADDTGHKWQWAEIAEAKFNYDLNDRNDWNGKFTINRSEYKERVDISRTRDGGISVSTGRFGKPLTEAARKRLVEILEPLVTPLQERLTMEDYWEVLEGQVRGRVRSALHEAVDAAEKMLRENGMTHYSAKHYDAPRTEAELTRAHDMAVRVVNEEVKKLSTVRTLSAGFEKNR